MEGKPTALPQFFSGNFSASIYSSHDSPDLSNNFFFFVLFCSVLPFLLTTKMMLYVDRYLCHVWVLCCRNTFDPLITLTPTMDKDVTSSCKLCSWLNMEKVCKEFRFLRLSPTFPLKLELFHMGKMWGKLWTPPFYQYYLYHTLLYSFHLQYNPL